MSLRAGSIRTLRLPVVASANVPVAAVSTKKGVCYCRVDSRRQEAQMWECVNFMRRKFPEYDVIADVGSGWDYRRTGLMKLMQRVMNLEVSDVVVTHRDQLSTSTHPHLMNVMEYYGTQLHFVQPVEVDETAI